MLSESEKAISWLRDQIVSPETPPAIREELKRHLRSYRQRSDDIFEEDVTFEDVTHDQTAPLTLRLGD